MDRFQSDILDQLQVLKGRDEVERLNVCLVTFQTPGKLLSFDQLLGKPREAFRVFDVEYGHLLETTVVRRNIDTVQGHLTQQYFFHLRRRRVPIHANRLAEVQLGREDTHLLQLAFEGERE